MTKQMMTIIEVEQLMDFADKYMGMQLNSNRLLHPFEDQLHIHNVYDI